MNHMLIFGLGYSARVLADRLIALGWTVESTGSAGDMAFDDADRVRAALGRATHVMSSVPPALDADPVMERYGDGLNHIWLGYLSSTGVYGDTQGAWVDETAPTGTGRRNARATCDALWLNRGARVFRLPGIYGPGRSAIDRVREGRANRIDLPRQIFSRIHVDDIADGVVAALDAPPGAYNLADDLPCSQNRVIEEACRITGLPLPPLQSMDEAQLSPMARGFYAENRRVANSKAKRILGWRLRYPDYRSGLAACAEEKTRG